MKVVIEGLVFWAVAHAYKGGSEDEMPKVRESYFVIKRKDVGLRPTNASLVSHHERAWTLSL